jgi:Holliday junction resolvase RusA-like endonuclease
MVETVVARNRARGFLMTARALSLDLPLPPSVNAAFCNVPGKGRVRTSIYRQWQKGALAEIAAQARGMTFLGTFRLSIAVSDKGLFRDRDGDNLAKAIADALTKVGVIVDDSYRFMRAIHLEWCHDLPGGNCVVEVRELSPAPLPKPSKAPRPKDAVRNTRAKPKPAAVPASIMRALRAKGINVEPERISIQ